MVPVRDLAGSNDATGQSVTRGKLPIVLHLTHHHLPDSPRLLYPDRSRVEISYHCCRSRCYRVLYLPADSCSEVFSCSSDCLRVLRLMTRSIRDVLQ